MDNHKQEVIDGFVKAIIPAYLKNELNDELFGNEYNVIDNVFSYAEALYEQHSKTCKICKANKELEELEIF